MIINFCIRLIIGMFFMSLGACHRSEVRTASIKLQFPKSLAATAVVSTLYSSTSTGFVGNYPINCYVALVSGPETEMQKNVCERKNDITIVSRKVGVWSGGLSEGQTLNLDIPAGSDRTVMIGGFYAQNGSCVDFNKSNTGEGLSRFYFLGEVNKVKLSSDQSAEINVPISFDSNNWFDQCRGTDLNFSVSSDGCPVGVSCIKTINIVSATYGQNCGQQDNRTLWLGDLCNGKVSCESCPLDVGDPAGGCAKDYVINYTCGTTAKTYFGTPEAGFSKHLISCP